MSATPASVAGRVLPQERVSNFISHVALKSTFLGLC